MSNQQDDPVHTAFRDHYIRAQYVWVQMLTEHLADCSRVFRGDLQAMLILAIIGQALLFRMLKNGTETIDAATPLPSLTGTAINASSISTILGIPRETVRRKLATLARQNWIEKTDEGWQIKLSDDRARAHHDLADLDARAIARIAKLIAAFNRLTEQHINGR